MRRTVLIAGVLACLGLVAGSAGADTSLSWQTEPVLGHSYAIPGDVEVTTDSGVITIPHYSIVGDPLYHVGGPSVGTFYINPTVWDPVSGHFYDPAVNVFSGSGINLDPLGSYHYTGVYSFLGNLGNPPYDVLAAENADFTDPSGFIMLVTGIGGFWPEDIGPWQYTETWTNNTDLGSITFTRGFEVSGPVPEPVTMFSAFMGLSTLGMYIRKRIKKQATA